MVRRLNLIFILTFRNHLGLSSILGRLGGKGGSYTKVQEVGHTKRSGRCHGALERRRGEAGGTEYSGLQDAQKEHAVFREFIEGGYLGEVTWKGSRI